MSLPAPSGVLRCIAAFLIRSPDAPYILSDLDEILERDVASGVPRWRARLRYIGNALASASILGREKLRAELLTWARAKETADRVVSLVAAGGTGKTALASFSLLPFNLQVAAMTFSTLVAGRAF